MAQANVHWVEEAMASVGARSRPRMDLFAHLSEPQKRFIHDPAKNKAALTSRQAGKTEAAIALLVSTCLATNKVNVVYINRSLKQGKMTIRDRVREFLYDHAIGFTWNSQDQCYSFENGSMFYISGAKDLDECDRFRGIICKLILLDETQDFRQEVLTYLLDKVLDACLFKHNGTLVMCGTPNTLCTGTFYDVTCKESPNYMGAEWSVTEWTYKENPGIPDKEQYVASVLKKHTWVGSEPEYLTEWCGKWVKDSRALLFDSFRYERNEFDQLPNGPIWQYVLGCDVGATRDLSTFCLWAWSMRSPIAYVVSAQGMSSTPDDAHVTLFCQRVQEYHAKIANLAVIMDDGGLGAGYLKELRNKYGVPAIGKNHAKGHKSGMVRIINDQFRAGRVLLNKKHTDELKAQLMLVRFDPKTQIEQKEDPCDFVDSFIYGYSYVYSLLHVPEEKKTQEQVTKEYEAQMFESTMQMLRPPEQVMEDEMREALTDDLPDWPNEV
jgi:hypothetical protein